MISLDVRLTHQDLLGAWRDESGHLLLHTEAAPRLGSRLAARLRLDGSGLDATVLGSVGSVLRDGGGHRVELVPDPSGAATVRLMVSAARGRAIRFRERAPRLAARLPAVLRSAGLPVYMDTVSVSGDGCALRWSGRRPEAGEPVALRIGAGPRATDLEGVVRWVTSRQAQVAAVGVAFAGGAARIGWLRWLDLVEAAGAPLL